MFNRQSALTLGGAILGVILAAVSAHGWENAGRVAYVTFSSPVSLPGVTLGSGTYVFDLPVYPSTLDLVRVMNKEKTTVYYTGFTRAIDRPVGLKSSEQISLGEAARGVPPPITAWFPDGGSNGHQFIYDR